METKDKIKEKDPTSKELQIFKDGLKLGFLFVIVLILIIILIWVL